MRAAGSQSMALGIGHWHTGTGMTDCYATNLGLADPPTRSPEEGDAIYSLVICGPAVSVLHCTRTVLHLACIQSASQPRLDPSA